MKTAVVCLLSASVSSVYAQPTITNLGTLPGATGSAAHGVSADGAVVVGGTTINSADHRAFRWTRSAGLENLGVLAGESWSAARAVSHDGSVVVGYADFWTGARAFRWTSGTGMQNLGALPGEIYSYASAVSGDGTVVVGSSEFGPGGRAVRWTSAGAIENLGAIPSDTIYSSASAVSFSGGIIFGLCDISRTFRWTQSAGMQDLQLDVRPSATNGEGSVVVGYHFVGSSTRGVRWNSADGIQNLGTPPGASSSRAFGLNGDGSIVVGTCDWPDNPRASMWTAALGMVDLNSYLPTLGLNLSGWILQEARAISSDGSTIVGTGAFNGATRAWVVTGLGHTACPGDLNGDATVSLQDLANLLAHFGGPGGPSDGDLDADGDVDLSDLAILFANFGTTCP